MKDRRPAKTPESLAGQLLLAHPGLRDPNFKRTVILMSVHNAEGAMGVVLNRPLDRQLGELNSAFALGPLAGVPLFCGGPVEPQQLVLVSWQWLDGDEAFQLQFGVDPAKAAELVGTAGVTIRGFLGYSGWGQGQLENEMKHQTWVVSPVGSEALEPIEGIALWRGLLGGIDPGLKLLANEPEDPELN